METLLTIAFMIVCILLILVVLLQKGRGGGLGSLFGGTGSAAFGAKTGDVFTWITIVLTALFLILAVTSNLVIRPEPKKLAMPTFDPPMGVPTDVPQEVQIRSENNGTIHYTLDGSKPTAESTAYEGDPVRVYPGQTLQAIAVRGGEWIDSDVASITFPDADAAETQPASTQPATATAPAN